MRIKAENLSFAYPSSPSLFSGLTFTLPETGLIYLIGESGSGKSTLLKILTGLISGYEGSVTWNERELRDISSKERTSAYASLFSFSLQDDMFEEDETVHDAVGLGLSFSSEDESLKERRIREALLKTRILPLQNKKILELSGGEKHRVSLARALVRKAEVYVFDEPLGALHSSLRKHLTEVFKDLSKNHLVLVVTHSLEEVRKEDARLVLNNHEIEAINFPTASDKFEKCEQGKKISSLKLFKRALKTLLRQRRRCLLSVFASSVALISFGLITLFSSSLEEGLNSYFTSEQSDKTILLQQRENNYTSTDFKSAPYHEASVIASYYPTLCAGVGTYYDINYETMFPNRNLLYFEKDDYRLSFPSLSFRNLAEFTSFSEQDKILSHIKTYAMDDIGLELKANDYYKFLDFIGKTSESIDGFLRETPFYLHVELANESFKYRFEMLLHLREIFSGEKSRFFHQNPLFFENMLEKEMHFMTVDNKSGPFSNPWTVYKSYTLLPRSGKKAELKKALLYDKRVNDKTLSLLSSSEMPSKYEKGEGAFLVLCDYQDSFHLSEIKDMERLCGSGLKDVGYSDSFYYYSDQGNVHGFLRPVYVAKDQEKINEIADYHYEAEFDLSGFQGSTIVTDDEVVMGDLSGSVEKPLQFHTLYQTELMMGRKPSFNETAVSSGLASILFGTLENALNHPLYLTCLTRTVYQDGGYKNIFEDGMLMIRGIVKNDEENIIYGNEDALLFLAEEQFGFKEEELKIEAIVFSFDNDTDIVMLQEKLQELYPSYRFSLPSLKMQEEITLFINRINEGLRVFALFSLLVAVLLLLFVMLLFLQEDERLISLRLSFGFSLSNIKEIYADYIFLLSLASFFYSSLFLLIFGFFFSSRLSEDLGMNFSTFVPGLYFRNFLLSLALALSSVLVTSLILKYRIKEKRRRRQF